MAEQFAATLGTRLGPDGSVDLVVLTLAPDGALGALAPGSAALRDPAWVAVIPATPGEPDRVSVTPALLAGARHVAVVATGVEVADAVAAALRDGSGPAACTLPSDRVTWIADRAAADALVRDAVPVA
jgi:6-phosphogluconolactonase/glucosamine-6-phosphate isomerase/deaminase